MPSCWGAPSGSGRGMGRLKRFGCRVHQRLKLDAPIQLEECAFDFVDRNFYNVAAPAQGKLVTCPRRLQEYFWAPATVQGT